MRRLLRSVAAYAKALGIRLAVHGFGLCAVCLVRPARLPAAWRESATRHAPAPRFLVCYRCARTYGIEV